jgi:hypothetical protein
VAKFPIAKLPSVYAVNEADAELHPLIKLIVDPLILIRALGFAVMLLANNPSRLAIVLFTFGAEDVVEFVELEDTVVWFVELVFDELEPELEFVCAELEFGIVILPLLMASRVAKIPATDTVALLAYTNVIFNSNVVLALKTLMDWSALIL